MIDIEESINRCQLAESVTQPAEDFLEILLELKAANAKLSRYEAALKFYADDKKYFQRERSTNLQETTAVFLVDNPEKLPTDFKHKSWEVSVKIKLDHGQTAREALEDAGKLARDVLEGTKEYQLLEGEIDWRNCKQKPDGRHLFNASNLEAGCTYCGISADALEEAKSEDAGKSSCTHGDSDPLECKLCREEKK